MSSSDIIALVALVKTNYETLLVPRLSGVWSGDQITGTDLSNNTGVTWTQALAGTPAAGGTTSPQTLACCVTWHINRHYRGGHPRTYLGPISNNNLENPTTFQAVWLSQTQANANAFHAAISVAVVGGKPCDLVAVHRVMAGTTLVPPVVSPITGAACDSRIDTMRRRAGPDR